MTGSREGWEEGSDKGMRQMRRAWGKHKMGMRQK